MTGTRVVATDVGAVDGGYGRFELRVPCSAGEIVATVLCGPVEPIRIQTVSWRLQPNIVVDPVEVASV